MFAKVAYTTILLLNGIYNPDKVQDTCPAIQHRRDTLKMAQKHSGYVSSQANESIEFWEKKYDILNCDTALQYIDPNPLINLKPVVCRYYQDIYCPSLQEYFCTNAATCTNSLNTKVHKDLQRLNRGLGGCDNQPYLPCTGLSVADEELFNKMASLPVNLIKKTDIQKR
jgi:hypothetical protein